MVTEQVAWSVVEKLVVSVVAVIAKISMVERRLDDLHTRMLATLHDDFDEVVGAAA